MAARSSRKPDRRYRTPGVVEGNLARKLDSRELERRLDSSGQMDFDQLYHRQRMTDAERRSKQRAKVKAAVRPAQHVSLAAVAGVLCVAGLMVVLLLCYIKMNTISRSIVSMKAQITQLEVDQVSLLTRHEQAQPSDSQVFYIRLPGEDQATVHKAGGGLGGFLAAFRFFTAAEYFR